MNAFRGAAVVLVAFAWLTTDAIGGERPASAAAKPRRTATEDAQRKKVWNSPAMLRARAWLEDYFAASAKITPEEAQEYRDHLRAMSSVQMKLWLLKFDEEERSRKQTEVAAQAARRFTVGEDQAALQQQQIAADRYNREASNGAMIAQQRIESQQERQNQVIAQRASPAPYGPYGFYPYSGFSPYSGYGLNPYYMYRYW